MYYRIPNTLPIGTNTVTQYMPSEPWKAFFNTIDDNQKLIMIIAKQFLMVVYLDN